LRDGLWSALILAYLTASSGESRSFSPAGARAIDFNRDIRPILSDNCFACHGPDKKTRKAGLRLDLRENATARLESGGQAVVPHDVARSHLMKVVSDANDDERMPPKESGKRLTQEQIRLLRDWIAQGAEFKAHWAYVTPERPALPGVKNKNWSRNEIDRFILARLEKEGLNPSIETEKHTLIRRVTFDLIGLPPTVSELNAFLADNSSTAYEKVVDRLLSSPAFGEKLALQWLDLARYADSDGYHDDTSRSMSQYRDYVIRSFNENKPFDQFTIEQLAGDLLPNATLDQKLASAFHRNGPTTSEGGADAKEAAARYAVDRVNTTATTWMGVTFQCAECHDHKYDPFTTREFYQLFAFFNQVPEDPLERALHVAPLIVTPTSEQQAKLEELTAQRAKAEAELTAALEAPDAELDAAQTDWATKLVAVDRRLELGPWQLAGPFAATNRSAAYETAFAPELAGSSNAVPWQPLPDWQSVSTNRAPAGLGAVYLSRSLQVSVATNFTLHLGSDDNLKVWLNGVLVHANPGSREVASNQDKIPLKVLPGNHQLVIKLANRKDGSRLYFSTDEKEGDPRYLEARRIAVLPPGERAEQDRAKLRRYYRQTESTRTKEVTQRLADAKKAWDEFERSIPRLRVMADVPERRPTYILVRGDYRNQGEEVSPGVPAVLGGRLPEDMKADRLALARWLTQPQHPLTSRVMVNRLWQMVFGIGLVKTAEEFGSQGEPPSHPELLDWLAVEFVESGWNVRHLLKRIVTSATYRQSSKLPPELAVRDPENRLLARGPRFRLPAEVLRDNALAVSGLLDRGRAVGGTSVKPYQPGDLWREFSYGDSADKSYVRDKGTDLYRRSLYTFWKRSVLYPAYALFDAPNREVCTARRPVTNTPLQAYVLLNDETFVEAARALAQKVTSEAPSHFEDQLRHAFRLALARPPSRPEARAMESLHREMLAEYQAKPEAAEKLLSVGDAPRTAGADPVRLAAWTCVANAILNFDETITKE